MTPRTNTGPAARRVLVIGAGVAGLSLAVALRRRGIDADVVDTDGRAEGASIGLTDRAVDVLEELDLLADCTAAGNALSGSVFDRMYDAAGAPLPLPPVPARADSRLPGAVVIHRGELARILREHAEREGATVRTGLTAERLVTHADGV
jgi:2-polyprenyl-6-methoxyphenol hydroxylase-like FAD-dependent oxidoreductase